MNTFINYKEWDSEFFGCKVGLIEDAELYEEEKLHYELVKSDYDIVYIFSSTVMKQNLFNLAERKLTFHIETQYASQPMETIAEIRHQSNFDYDSLLNMVYRSGHLSRFKLDKRFPANSYKDLYKIWIDKSLSGELAFGVLGYFMSNNLVGFVTVSSSEESEIAKIGLIAVNPLFSGRGIGKDLVAAALFCACNNGYSILEVATQGANTAAIKLYEKSGFTLKNEQFIYHYFR